MTFYEVHDGDGCLVKTRDLRAAKWAAAAYLTMKSGRELHIRIYTDGPAEPTGRIRLDPFTRIWTRPEPCRLNLGRSVETQPREGRSLVALRSVGHEKQLPARI